MNQLNESSDKYDDSNDKLKTIVVSKKNYDKLKGLGFGGDSFNTIVGRLIEKVQENI